MYAVVSATMNRQGDYLSEKHVSLQARRPEDIVTLQTMLYDDLQTRARADTRAWQPIPPDPDLSPYAVKALADDVAFFSIVTTADGELVGEALLWGIDLHNRVAHIGLAILPAFRGRGWSVEVLQLLCRYGFAVRGLNRLQFETHAENAAMIRAGTRAGFLKEGVLRQAAWAIGSFADCVVMGLLAEEWRAASSGTPSVDRAAGARSGAHAPCKPSSQAKPIRS